MEQTRTKYVIQNIIFALVGAVVGTVLPFFVRTYTIRYLGSEYMGLNNLCAAILNVLMATDLGVANAFAFRLYKPMALGDKEEICRLLNFYRKIYFAIGMVILGIGMMILPFFERFISSDIPQDVNVYIVFFLYLINTVISYTVFAYKSLIFTADQRNDYGSITTSITFGVLYIVQIVLIRFRLYYISVGMLPVCTLLGNLMRNNIAHRKYPEYIPYGNSSRDEMVAMARDVFSVAVYKFRDISRNTFDNIVISTFMGLVVLSDYQNYYMIFYVPVWILSIFYTSVLPSVGNYAISNSQDKVYEIYKKNVFVMSIMAAWFAISYCFLIQDFIVVWLGAEFLLSRASAILFSVYIYLYGESMIIKIMRESIGLWNQGRIWAVIEMLANLVLNVFMGLWFGVEGIILATIVSMFFISIPIENWIIFSQYFAGNVKDKIKSMAVNTLWTIGTAIIVGILSHFAPRIQYVSFFYKTCVCLLIPPLSCALCFQRTEEFKFVKDIIQKIIVKR